jgi:hypothetical protein
MAGSGRTLNYKILSFGQKMNKKPKLAPNEEATEVIAICPRN